MRAAIHIIAIVFTFGIAHAFAPSSRLVKPFALPRTALRVSIRDIEKDVRKNMDGPIEKDAVHKSSMYQVRRGPHGHLIDADEEKLEDLDEQPQQVSVNEVAVDPITVTALLFAAIAINFILFAHWGDAGLGGFVARIQNFARQ